jgi:hypothetical protein
MENLSKALEEIQKEDTGFFEKNNLRLSQYVTISKKPVMLWFNTEMQHKYRLPNNIFLKLNELIMSYYSLGEK